MWISLPGRTFLLNQIIWGVLPNVHCCCSVSHVWLVATPLTAACQASLSFTNSWSLLKLKSIEMHIETALLMLKHTRNAFYGENTSESNYILITSSHIPASLSGVMIVLQISPPAKCVTLKKSQCADLSNGNNNNNTFCRGWLSWCLTEGNHRLDEIIVEALQFHLEMVSELIRHTRLEYSKNI